MGRGLRSFEHWAIGLVTFSAFWLLGGYRYFVNSGIETVPLVLRYLDQEYLRNDYWLNIVSSTVHLRYVVVRIVAIISKIFGSVEASMFVIYVISYVVLFSGVVKIAYRFTLERRVVCIAVIVSVYFLYAIFRKNPGSILLIPNEMSSNLIVRAILVWAVVCAIAGQVNKTFGLIIVAAFIHPLEALLSYPVITAISVVAVREQSRKFNYKKLAVWSLILCVAIALMSLDSVATRNDGSELTRAFIERRLGHHYLPYTWAPRLWIMLGVISVAGSASLYFQGQRDLLAGCAVGLGLWLFYILCIQISDSTYLIILQGSKVLILPYYIWSLSIFVLVATKLGGTINSREHRLLATVVLGSAVVIAITLSVVLNKQLTDTPKAFVVRQVNFLLSGNYRRALDYIEEDERRLYKWIKKNTLENDVILHPPDMVYIRPIARRSSVFQNHLVSFNSKGMKAWMERSDTLEGFCKMSILDLKAIARKYNASWIIVRESCARVGGEKVSFRNASWIVVRSDV